MRKQINGILLLDKPKGLTSNGALQKVKHLFHGKKAGHTGSLDPIATGMLPICFGEATKFSQFLLESDKTYHVVAKLGSQTTTGDSEGQVVATTPIAHISSALIEKTLSKFVGEIEQVPPMYSAIKHKGKPLYELARKGIEIERKPRRITIFSLKFEQFDLDHFSFYVHCTKGTYVRTLVEDIGRELNCGAHVVELRRLSVNPYANHSMHSLDSLIMLSGQNNLEKLFDCLLPIETAVEVFPQVRLSTEATFYLLMGQPVRTNVSTQNSLVRLVSEDSTFLGIGEIMVDGRVRPHRLVSRHKGSDPKGV